MKMLLETSNFIRSSELEALQAEGLGLSLSIRSVLSLCKIVYTSLKI